MAIQGLRHTANFVANQRPENWREAVLTLYPNGSAPLTAMTSLMKSEDTDDPIYHWWEKNLQTRRLKLVANANATDVLGTLAVEDGAFGLKEGDLLMSEATNEIMHVYQNPASDTVVPVSRGTAGSTKAAITIASQNPYVVVIGSAYEEASPAPLGVNFDPSESSNYTQIFRNTHEISGTAEQTRLRTGDAQKEAKRECLELHSVDMERAFWFGRKSASTRNGKPWRTTGGIINAIPASRKHTYSAPLTMGEWEEDLKAAFDFGSSEKVAFGGNRALLTMQQLIRRTTGVNYDIKGSKEYGMNVTRFTSPFGTLVLKTHPLFNQMASVPGSYNAMDSAMVILDMENIRYRYLKGRDTKYQKRIEEDGVDGNKNGYITECGLEVNRPLTHYVIFGLTGAADEA